MTAATMPRIMEMQTMCDAKLSPCPKCGGKVYVYQRDLINGYYVCCDDMRCKWVLVTANYKTWQEAADAWNAGKITITPIRTR